MRRCPRPLSARSAPRARQPRYTLIEMFARPRGWPGLREFVRVFAGSGLIFPDAGRKAWATRRARAAQLALPLLPAQQPLFPPRRPR